MPGWLPISSLAIQRGQKALTYRKEGHIFLQDVYLVVFGSKEFLNFCHVDPSDLSSSPGIDTGIFIKERRHIDLRVGFV